MHGMNDQIALLLSFPQGKDRERSISIASRLYEVLTCNGSLGPSDIQMLAPRGVLFSEMEPTIGNLKKAIAEFASKDMGRCRCLVYLDGDFDGGSLKLSGSGLDLGSLSDLLSGLPCQTMNVFLHGRGSELASGSLEGPGRTIVFTARSDGLKKDEDPFDITRLFVGEHITGDNIEAEKRRLKASGYVLEWTKMSHKPDMNSRKL